MGTKSFSLNGRHFLLSPLYLLLYAFGQNPRPPEKFGRFFFSNLTIRHEIQGVFSEMGFCSGKRQKLKAGCGSRMVDHHRNGKKGIKPLG
jgi:hypothetical protein